MNPCGTSRVCCSPSDSKAFFSPYGWPFQDDPFCLERLQGVHRQGVKVGSTAELLKAWEDGKVVITSKNGSVAEYGKVLDLLENDEILTIVNLKKSNFDCLSGSPQRF